MKQMYSYYDIEKDVIVVIKNTETQKHKNTETHKHRNTESLQSLQSRILI